MAIGSDYWESSTTARRAFPVVGGKEGERNTTPRLLAKLLREVIAGQDYRTIADVVADLKTRAGRLRIRWTTDDIRDALAMVQPQIHNALINTTPTPRELPGVEPIPQARTEEILEEVERRWRGDVAPQPLKQCTQCEGWYDPRVFFRRHHGTNALVPQGTRAICIGCEQDARDSDKSQDRWPTKIRDTIRRHADRLKVQVGELEERYGWNFERLLHEARHAYANGCSYCGKPYLEMGHGLNDLTLDIFNRTEAPHYSTNVRWCCQTCNREKAKTPPAIWAAKLAAWAQWERNKRERLDRPAVAYTQTTLFDLL